MIFKNFKKCQIIRNQKTKQQFLIQDIDIINKINFKKVFKCLKNIINKQIVKNKEYQEFEFDCSNRTNINNACHF